MENEVFRLCAIAVLCAVVGAVLGRTVGSIGVAVRLGGLALVFGVVAALLGTAVDTAYGWVTDGGARYWSAMVRGLGIVTVCRICSDICRGCGESVAAEAVENGGKLPLVLVAAPMVEELIALAAELMEGIT